MAIQVQKLLTIAIEENRLSRGLWWKSPQFPHCSCAWHVPFGAYPAAWKTTYRMAWPWQNALLMEPERKTMHPESQNYSKWYIRRC